MLKRLRLPNHSTVCRPLRQRRGAALRVLLAAGLLILTPPLRPALAAPWLAPLRPSELRGVWAHYYGVPDWEETVRTLHESGFNAVFPYMCSAGVAYYPSHLLPISEKARSTDYLAAATRAGRQYGVEVHARMLVLEVLFSDEQTKARLARQGRLMRTAAGKTLPWLCPTHPHNREQLVGVALEMVRNYPLQGLQLDYIRYPHRDSCFCSRCQRQFVQDCGAKIKQWPQDVITGAYQDQFARWRCQQLTSLVREIGQTAKSIAPDLAISAAVFPDWQSARERLGQDVAAWVEQDLVDFVCPMNYTADAARLSSWLQHQRRQVAGRVRLIAGLGPFSDACQFSGPRQLADQILIARTEGAAGFIVFNYNEQLAKDYLPHLALTVTRHPASPGPSPLLTRF